MQPERDSAQGRRVMNATLDLTWTRPGFLADAGVASGGRLAWPDSPFAQPSATAPRGDGDDSATGSVTDASGTDEGVALEADPRPAPATATGGSPSLPRWMPGTAPSRRRGASSTPERPSQLRWSRAGQRTSAAPRPYARPGGPSGVSRRWVRRFRVSIARHDDRVDRGFGRDPGFPSETPGTRPFSS